MRILVTGAHGFVGGYLSEHLQQVGDEVVATAEPGSDRDGAIPLDIRERDNVHRVLEEVQPDAVIHLAAISFVPDAEADTSRALDINVAGVDHLARALVSLRSQARLVFASSPEVYGKTSQADMPLTESHEQRPSSNYGLSKCFAEAVLRRWRAEGLETTILRPFNHIGPRQSDRFVTSSFARQLAQIKLGKKSPVLSVGNLEARRDFTDVRDIVRGYRLAAAKGGDVYHLCSGTDVSVKEVLDMLIEIAEVQVDIQPDPDRMRPSDIPILVGSAVAARRDLGWERKIPLRQTLEELFAYWLESESALA